MFMTTQPWQNDDDYRKLIQNLEPPPPPGKDNGWELHFCKWWGWNWVRKKEGVVEETPMQNYAAPKPIEGQPKKPEKKPVKHLCKSLCFRKKKEQKPLQDRYNTPSNSVIENRDENKKKSISHTEDDDRKIKMTHKSDSIQKEVEEQIIKEVRNELYASASAQTKKEKRRSKEWSTSSAEEYCCCCRDRDRSSTESSVECINITCCSCCPTRDQPPTKKDTIEKYTQDIHPQCKMIATQTEEREKKRRRRRICVVCCCRCKQNSSPPCCACCSCSNIRNIEEKMEKKAGTCPESTRRRKSIEVEPGSYKNEKPLPEKHENSFSTYRAAMEQQKPSPKHPNHLKQKFEPLYATGMPIDTMLYHNKPITKFGIPSRSYSWIHAAKSDIWDQFFHSRMNNDLSNSASRKTYNVSPIKLHDLESEPSVFNPLSVDKEMETLKQIENDIKTDLKSRIMLDAVCDAILSKDDEPDASSSIFLNEFTYPSNVTQTECIINDIYKSGQTNTCSKLNQTGLEGTIFEDATSKPYKNKVSCETNTSSLHLSVGNQENHSLRDYINVRSPQLYAMDNSHRRPLHSPCVALNYNMQRERLIPSENRCPHKLINYGTTNNYPLIPTQRRPTFTRTRVVPTVKRGASPSPRGREIKKVKLESPTLPSLTSTNVSDIFKKIDEIILRSKVNNDEIQTVLNTIPKKTYKFFTSWEVSNLMNHNHALQNVEPEENVNSYMESISEGKKEKNEKIKAPQLKKKKICSRPSLIPKRVTDSKLNKKNTG